MTGVQICMRYIVKGRVQGVFFRASTQRQAQQLGVTGYAKNLSDGSVEVLACGRSDAVQRLGEWLSVGPSAARVSTVDCQPVDVQVPARFTTA